MAAVVDPHWTALFLRDKEFNLMTRLKDSVFCAEMALADSEHQLDQLEAEYQKTQRPRRKKKPITKKSKPKKSNPKKKGNQTNQK
jgi:hypothetical protein